MLKMIQPRRPLSPNEIAAFESRLQLQLPVDYRQFLAANNGGISVECQTKYLHRYYEERHTLGLFDWFSVVAEEDGRLTIEQAMKNLNRMCPKGMIPIAQSAGGEPVLLSLTQSNFGIVYVLDPEVPDHRSISVVAKSFSDFINVLEPNE